MKIGNIKGIQNYNYIIGRNVRVSETSEKNGIVQLLLLTPEDREVSFSNENKIIELEEGESFSDRIEVEEVWLRTDIGTATVKIYVSW